MESGHEEKQSVVSVLEAENRELRAQLDRMQKALDRFEQKASEAAEPAGVQRKHKKSSVSPQKITTEPSDDDMGDGDHLELRPLTDKAASKSRKSPMGLHRRVMPLSPPKQSKADISETAADHDVPEQSGASPKRMKAKQSDVENGDTLPDDDEDDTYPLVSVDSGDIEEDDEPPQSTHVELPFRRMVYDRASWLVGLLVLQSMSSFIIKRNGELLKKHSAIVQFLTMLVGAGGNAGNQASVGGTLAGSSSLFPICSL